RSGEKVTGARSDRGRDWRHSGCSDYAFQFGAQPLRKTGLMNLLASVMLVIRILTGSYSILPSTRSAITPSSIHSTNGPATLKFEQDGSPPLQARIQSR